MDDIKIAEIFQKDITRKINGVVKADQNADDIIITELSEYVVTRELRKHFDKFFDRYVKSLDFPTEDMGVWISGFYGSGKSHFLKMIGRILENKEYDGKKVIEYFKNKIEDSILEGNIEKSSEIPTDVILFNVDNVSDQDTYKNKDSIAVAFLKNFNGYFGFSKENLKIASFERELWKKGILTEFREKIENVTGKEWKDVIRNLDFNQDDFIEVVEEMGIMTEESVERWLEKDDKVSVSPESFADLLEEYLKIKGNKHRIVFLVDEIGQYIGDNSQLMLNLQTLVEVLGVRFQGRVWVIVTSQQDLGNILNEKEHRKNDFSKIQDRFKTILSLSSGNIDEVIKKRLLEKKNIDKENLEKLYDENYITINNIINFDKNGMILPKYSGKFDFAETYPFVDYQFSLLQKVFERVRESGFSGQHMSRGERSLLSSFQEAGIKVKDKKMGTLIPFNYFFESIEQFLEDIAKRPFIIAKNERGINDFELEVLKLLFLLKGIPGVETNINNLTSFMIDSIDCDRIELESRIKKALIKLEQQVLIQKDGNNYYFLTNEEQDINKEINQENIDYSEVCKQIDSYIFGEIFTKNSIISEETKNKYTFSRKIDEYNTSKRGEQLDINILTPSAEEYNQISLLGFRDAEHDLIIKLSEKETLYLDEIKLYLKIENFVRRKNTENTRDSISQILIGKQRENNNRRKRIKFSLEQAILEADVFVHGQKITLPSLNDPAKIIEYSLKSEANYRFKSANLLKKLYDENAIKNILSYTFDSGISLYDIGKEIENNQNKEAIQEVRNRIELQNRIGRTVTVKDLVEHFSKAPYGWGLFSINGIIAELWQYKMIDLQESKEIVTKSEIVRELLTKSQSRNLERIVVTIKEEIDTELIKKVNNILQKAFGNGVEISIDLPKENLVDVLEKRKNISNSYLRECKNGNYPGEKELKEWIEILEDIISNKNNKTEKFLKDFVKDNEEFLELYYNQSDVEDFFNINKNSKKKKYDMARTVIKNIEDNIGYMKDVKEISAYKELISITEDKKPYSRIREIDDLIGEIRKEENKIIENEKELLIKKAEEQKLKLKNSLNDNEIFLQKIDDKFESFINKVKNIDTIKKIMSDTKELENINNEIKKSYREDIKSKIGDIEKEALENLQDKTDIDELVSQIKKYYSNLKDEIDMKNIDSLKEIIKIAEKDKEQFILQGNGKAKKKERVNLKKISVSSKYNLETEEDVKEYIISIEKEIEKLKSEMLKAINENKIVDIN